MEKVPESFSRTVSKFVAPHIAKLQRGHLFHCPYVANVQVHMWSPVAEKWYCCAQCHLEREGKDFPRSPIVGYLCLNCTKTFRKDLRYFGPLDEYCPSCNNHYLLEAAFSSDEDEDSGMSPGALKRRRRQRMRRQAERDAKSKSPKA